LKPSWNVIGSKTLARMIANRRQAPMLAYGPGARFAIPGHVEPRQIGQQIADQLGGSGIPVRKTGYI
jgi:hypothetical protein